MTMAVANAATQDNGTVSSNMVIISAPTAEPNPARECELGTGLLVPPPARLCCQGKEPSRNDGARRYLNGEGTEGFPQRRAGAGHSVLREALRPARSIARLRMCAGALRR
jgi:hypothetical protein